VRTEEAQGTDEADMKQYGGGARSASKAAAASTNRAAHKLEKLLQESGCISAAQRASSAEHGSRAACGSGCSEEPENSFKQMASYAT
jgi:hypothetical protein